MASNSSGIVVTLKELIDLRNSLIQQPLSRFNKWDSLSGNKLSRIRGRGIEFDATREYQAGDDIRSMAWRVTARSLKPHIKIYREEKERPVWLAVDLSPSLYFGTRCMFKSARIIKQAAALGWSYLLKRERIGAIIAAQKKIELHRPQSSEKNYLTILNSLVGYSRISPAFSDNGNLHELLLAMQYQVRSGNLIYILSDFYQFDSEIQKLIIPIAKRAQLNLIFIYDPFEAEAPPPYQYMLTNGRHKAVFNMVNTKSRLQYQQQFQTKQNALMDFTRKHNITLQIICTDQQLDGMYK